MRITKKYIDEISYSIIGCAIEVHKTIGPGLLESIYEKCLLRELQLKGHELKSQQNIPLEYKGIHFDAQLRYDVLVDNLVVVELKAIEGILPIHEAVLLTYMKMLMKPKGVILNFNVTNIFKFGQKTMVNEYYRDLTEK